MAALMSLWEAGCAAILRGVALLHGPSKVREIQLANAALSSLVVYTVHGYEVTICVESRYYERSFSRFYMPTRRMVNYHVFAQVPVTAPERLRSIAGDFSVDMPRQYSSLATEVLQKQAAVDAYLDMLIDRLDRRHPRDLIKLVS